MDTLLIVRSGFPLAVLTYLSYALDQVIDEEDSELTYKRVRLVKRPAGVTIEYETDLIQFKHEGKPLAKIIFPLHSSYKDYEPITTNHATTAGS
jgi:hypothetical protein